jgi:hypothetical protein
MNANNPMVNEARVDCKSKAETQAKYGSPKWPWFAFGAMLHTRATYRYDLNHPHESPNNSNLPDVVLDEAP